MSFQYFHKRLIWVVSGLFILALISFLVISERSGEQGGKREDLPQGSDGARSVTTSRPSSDLSERSRLLRNELLRDPAAAWKMLDEWRGEGADSETIMMITTALFWDDREKMVETISGWPHAQASPAWRGCMSNVLEHAAAGMPPEDVLKAIKLIPVHYSVSDFAHGVLAEKLMDGGSEPRSLLESLESPDAVSDSELKKLFLVALGQSSRGLEIRFQDVPTEAMGDFVTGRARARIKGTAEWLAEGFSKQPDARELLREAIAAVISLDATRGSRAFSEVEDPIFRSIFASEMARAATIESNFEVASEWVERITEAELRADTMEEVREQAQDLENTQK